ncbi:transmembrane protein 106A [Clupea harengus]|uniref:Transmembrane protein 106A n=1 Tax=Clupea harengus TaxID=7950 RepID=A0A6P3VEG9_CLUHA|nr:transmembrane protein 106A [Clupea harengus]
MVSFGHGSSLQEDQNVLIDQSKDKRRLSKWREYGSTGGDSTGDTCPTCHGIGRIPRGQENQLVAVIPCSDQRLRPRHTKLYVSISVAVCLLTCALILFFLFPRSMTLSPVINTSVLVYFTPSTVEMKVTNVLNITNENFVSVQAHDMDLQALIWDTVVGKIKISNVTTVPPRSEKLITVEIPITIEDIGLNGYCKSVHIRIHTLFLHLQMTMKVFYLGHSEQLSMDTFQYIDCGTNSTIPRPT